MPYVADILHRVETMRRFLPSDLPELNRWLRAFHLGEFPSMEILPPTGFILPGGAAGFLYFTDSPVAFLVGLTPCSDIPSARRILAMRRVARRLMRAASEKGVRQVVTWTTSENIAIAAVKTMPFRPVEQALVLVASLSPKEPSLVQPESS